MLRAKLRGPWKYIVGTAAIAISVAVAVFVWFPLGVGLGLLAVIFLPWVPVGYTGGDGGNGG
jgi:hypothetical protein